MDQLTLLFLLMFGTVVVVPVARRLRLPYPVLLTFFGLLLGWLPFVPSIGIDPELLLPLLLPPLIHAAAQRSSLREFTANARPILLLAVALVVVTTAAVAAVATAIVPGLPVAAAVALGALVAPPDPVAAGAVAGALRLPRRILTLLEGEGLFNDVTALVLYQVAVGAAVAGSFSPLRATGDLALAALVAVVVGLAVGYAARFLLRALEDATLQTLLTLLVPYVSYVTADELHGSGVLAVLTAALFLGETAEDADNVVGRLTGRAFWEVVELVVTGVAFGVVGLELWEIVENVEHGRGRLVWQCAVIVVLLVVVRALWLFPIGALTRRLHQEEPEPGETQVPTARETVVLWWAGMRGVVTLALALALPYTVDGGGPFPERERFIVIAFAVVFVTLLLPGLTLPSLVRRLRVGQSEKAAEAGERAVAARATRAGLRRLAELEDERDLPDDVVERLRSRHRARLARLGEDPVEAGPEDHVVRRERLVHLAREVEAEMTDAARREVLDARGRPGTDPTAADRVLRRLDLRSVERYTRPGRGS